MEPHDLARISRILQTEECVQPVSGGVTLVDGVLTLTFDATRSDAQDAKRALWSHHLNAVIDENMQTDENSENMVDGMAVLEIDVLDPLWKHPETTPPSRVTKL